MPGKLTSTHKTSGVPHEHDFFHVYNLKKSAPLFTTEQRNIHRYDPYEHNDETLMLHLFYTFSAGNMT